MRTGGIKKALVAATTALGACALAAPAHALDTAYATSPSLVNGDSVNSTDAQCPPGYKITGGGGFGNGDYLEMRLQASFPVDGTDGNTKPDDAWQATQWNTASTARNMEAQAICADLKTKVVSKPFRPGRTFGKAKCPEGYNITGGGIESSPTFADSLELVESTPFGNANVQGWFALAFTPTTGATTYAVCALDEDVVVRFPVDFVPIGPAQQGSGSGFCKPSQDLIGVGADTLTQQAAIVTIYGADSPSDANNDLDDGTNVKVDHYGTTPDLEVETHSICAK